MVTLAKRMRDLREDHDLSQKEIARLLNVDQARVSEWERGQYEPRLEVLFKLADYYEVSLDYLCGLSDDPRRPGDE